jgi:D-alanyl-D-alanine carboxypeptidase
VGNSLDALSSYTRPQVEAWLAGCAARGVPCDVIDTDRTPSEQQVKLAQKRSWTKVSKHEPQPPEQKSEAADICPQVILERNKANWEPEAEEWQIVGQECERAGLFWGGRWKHINETSPGANDGTGDPSHGQYVHARPQILTDTELSTQ